MVPTPLMATSDWLYDLESFFIRILIRDPPKYFDCRLCLLSACCRIISSWSSFPRLIPPDCGFFPIGGLFYSVNLRRGRAGFLVKR